MGNDDFTFPEKLIIPPIQWNNTLHDVNAYGGLLESLRSSHHDIKKYNGFIEGRKIGFFHIVLATLEGVKYLIMPPGGIGIEKGENEKGHVKNFHPAVVETAQKSHARLIAVINFSPVKGGHLSMMENIEQAGYRRSGVNMRQGFIVLNHGNDARMHQEFGNIGFTQL